MDPLTYIRKALTLLHGTAFPHFLRIGPEGEAIEIGSLNSLPDMEAGECYSETLSAPDLPTLAAKIPALLKKYGIDYPAFP